MEPSPEALRIVELEVQVAELEQALEKRSLELRRLLRGLSYRDLERVSQILRGLPPVDRHAYEPSAWVETTALTRVEVEETLEDLWDSLSGEREAQEGA